MSFSAGEPDTARDLLRQARRRRFRQATRESVDLTARQSLEPQILARGLPSPFRPRAPGQPTAPSFLTGQARREAEGELAVITAANAGALPVQRFQGRSSRGSPLSLGRPFNDTSELLAGRQEGLEFDGRFLTRPGPSIARARGRRQPKPRGGAGPVLLDGGTGISAAFDSPPASPGGPQPAARRRVRTGRRRPPGAVIGPGTLLGP